MQAQRSFASKRRGMLGTSMSEASTINRAYYESEAAGRGDYWRKMAAPRHRVRTLLRELARDRPHHLIDLGCGNGAFLSEVARHLPQTSLAGLDLSRSQIEQSRRSLPAIRWHAHDLDSDSDLPIGLHEAFDAVVAMELVEHLDHPARFLGAARALASPRGRLYLSTQSGPMGQTERRVGHRRHYSAEEMRALLLEAGWHPLRVWNTGFPFHDLSKWYANRDPENSLSRFGQGAYTWREDLVCVALRLAFRLNSRKRGAQLFAVAIPTK